jgi:hypothetical protein
MTAKSVAIAIAVAIGCTTPAHAGRIDSGVIKVGRGPAGATLGMTRAQVVAALGDPVDENTNGVMSYQPFDTDDAGIFDVYRNHPGNDRVRLFILSFVGSTGWTLGEGNHIFRKGAIKRLYRHYGSRVHKRDVPEDGSKYYVIRGHFHGRKVETAFQVTRFSRAKAKVLDVYVSFAD